MVFWKQPFSKEFLWPSFTRSGKGSRIQKESQVFFRGFMNSVGVVRINPTFVMNLKKKVQRCQIASSFSKKYGPIMTPRAMLNDHFWGCTFVSVRFHDLFLKIIFDNFCLYTHCFAGFFQKYVT